MTENADDLRILKYNQINILALCSLILGMFFINIARAQTLTEAQVYQRCYTRMTGKIALANDPRLQQINAGHLTADNGCLQLFDLAKISAETNVLMNMTNSLSLDVIRQIHQLHRSWFESRTLTAVNNGGLERATAMVFDIEEPALYFTRAALRENTSFSSAVTHNKTLRGIRQRPNSSSLLNFLAQNFFLNPQGYSYTNEEKLIIAYPKSLTSTRDWLTLDFPDEKIVTVGELIGIGQPADYIIPLTQRFIEGPEDALSDLVDAESAARTNVNLFAHSGGGIVGSAVYLMSNANLGSKAIPNGEETINRRVSARAFKDLMCHELPVLNESDVIGEVQAESQYAFRRSSSCMSCHASIDPFAFTLRNKVLSATALAPRPSQDVGQAIVFFASLGIKNGSQAFALQQPQGRLTYRSHLTSNKTDLAVTSIADIGLKISESNDFYLCAAKRYYQFFTGVNVALSALNEKSSTYQIDKLHQDFVVSLGETLKQTQSVRSTFSKIFKSDIFKDRNYLISKEVGGP